MKKILIKSSYDNDFASYQNVRNGKPGSKIEIRLDAPNGELIQQVGTHGSCVCRQRLESD